MQETKVSSKIKLKALHCWHVLSKPKFFSWAILSYTTLLQLLHPVGSAFELPPQIQTNNVLVCFFPVVHPATAAMVTQVSSETPTNAHQQKHIRKFQ